MKIGDLVKFRNLDPSWGEFALIVDITQPQHGAGMIKMITKAQTICTIPWVRRNKYIGEIINETI